MDKKQVFMPRIVKENGRYMYIPKDWKFYFESKEEAMKYYQYEEVVSWWVLCIEDNGDVYL